MAMRRGITQKLVYIHNPCPEVTEASLLEAAGLDMLRAGNKDPFQIVFKYGVGTQKEQIYLAPGDFAPLREPEAEIAYRRLRDKGLVLIEDPDDVEEILPKSINGLQRLAGVLRERGPIQISKFMRTNAVSKDELENYKYDPLWPYYVNEARMNVVMEHIKTLQNSGVPAEHEEKE